MDLRGYKVWRCGLDSRSSGQGPASGSCEHSNEPLGSKGGGEFDLAEWLLTSQNELCSKELVCYPTTEHYITHAVEKAAFNNSKTQSINQSISNLSEWLLPRQKSKSSFYV